MYYNVSIDMGVCMLILDQTIIIRLSKEEKEKLKQMALEKNINVSMFLRDIIKEQTNKWKKKNK